MKVFLIAGEPSGDKLGAALMAGLQQLIPGVSFKGVAGPQMQGQGMQSLFPMEELSVMGLAEILPKYFDLKRRIRETAQAVLTERPDVLITIDSPDFCLRVARLVKAASDIRVVHYVAPTVWAWRPGRAERMAKVVDQVLALFPFEPPYMEAAGMDCDFVGHPVAAEPPVSAQEVATFRVMCGLDKARPTLVVLPGSRKSEIERLGAVFSEAINRADLGDLQIVIPTLPHLVETVRAQLSFATAPLIVDGDGLPAHEAARQRLVAMAAADLALAASGTVSLDLARADTPMVIAYDMAWLSRQIISRMLRVDTVTLVNLVSGTRAVPEFIGKDCRPDRIARALEQVAADDESQRAALALTMERLGQGEEPPGLRAARAVIARL